MDNSIIEKFDKAQYNTLTWFTAGFGSWFGISVIMEFVHYNPLKVALGLFGVISSILFVISVFKLNQLGRKIRLNRVLRGALDNEYARFLRDRAFITGFWTFTIVTGLVLALSIFMPITALQVGKVILYFGIMATLLSFLISHRK